MRQLATIGVYGFDLGRFLATLHAAEVGLLLDVRQRRGVRGSEYAWANSARLQAALADAGIEYEHHKELAPTTELRRLQYEEDARRGEGKRSRTVIADAYRERYTREILGRVDLDEFAGALPQDVTPALMCVERDAAACHRSIVAERLHERFGFAVEHLAP